MKKTRKFNGVVFKYHSGTQNKINANELAERLRYKGYLVRRTYEKIEGEDIKYHILWYRKGRKTGPGSW